MFVHESETAHNISKVAGAFGVEALSGAWFGTAATAVDEAGNCAGLLSRLWNGGCFVPGTLVTLSEMPQGDDLPSALWADDSFLDDLTDHAGSGTALLEAPVTTKTTLQVPVEDVPLGARVPTKNPRPWEYDDGFAEPDEATWSKVNITAKRKDGQIVDAEILRPTAWLQFHGIIAGNTLPLNIPELQIDGEGYVETTEPCPPLAGGEGSVVTARFITRQVDQVATVEVLGPDGNTETLTGTTVHPVWSVDRQSWVELAELHEGERLQAADGEAIVVSVTVYKRSTPVYNIEVHGEHVYQVGELALLVHNAYLGTRSMRLSNLRPNPQRPFVNAEKLADQGPFDIAKYVPIEVHLIDGRHVIMDGMTRFENALRNGIKEMPVILYRYD